MTTASWYVEPDGRPFDPKSFDKKFKEYQNAAHIENEDQIEFQACVNPAKCTKYELQKTTTSLLLKVQANLQRC